MRRDMELCRKILFAIEEQYVDKIIYNLQIEGYSSEEISYNASLLYEVGLISSYAAQHADNRLHTFGVGHLTWEGHDFLDKIREDTVWNKIKAIIKEKFLPMTLEVIKDIASALVKTAVQTTIKDM